MNYIPAIGFIIYNPTDESVNRIVGVAKAGYQIFLFLNSELKEDMYKKLASVKSIHFIGNNLNEGLATGLKSICTAAYENKFRTLLYFDQDSIFTSETLEFVVKYCQNIQLIEDEFVKSIVCTTFRDKTELSKRYNHISTFSIPDFTIENVYFSINSGSLYFLDKLSEYQWFDQSYFVDGVDYSFCIRSIRNNLKITEIYNTPGLDHETEQGNLPVKFFNRQVSGRMYPLRRNVDFIKSHLRILFSSFMIKSFKPKIFIIRSMCSYLLMQILFRFKPKNK